MDEPRTPGFVEPRSLVFWTFIALLALGAYWRFTGMLDLWGSDTPGLYSSVVFWLLFGLVISWIIYRSQLFERRPVSSTGAAVAWGLFVAGGVATLAGQDLLALFDVLMGLEASAEWGPAIRAPLFEETLKYLGVVALALIPRVRLVRVIDGVFYGMLSGLGFLVSENAFFTNQEFANGSSEGVGGTILGQFMVRGVAALPFSHVVFTAIAGAGVGYVVSRRGKPLAGRLLVALGLYLSALLLHGLQNAPFLDAFADGLFIKGIPALAGFVAIVLWGRREYKDDLAGLADELGTISRQDVEDLSSRRRRRRAARGTEDPARARTTQRAQVDLLVAADIYGPASAEAVNAATALQTD